MWLARWGTVRGNSGRSSRSYPLENARRGRHKQWQQYLPVKTSHVRVGNNLRDDGADSQSTEHRRAVAVEVEVVTDSDRKGGPLFRRRHREELADLQPSLACCTSVSREVGAGGDGDDLCDGLVEQ